MSQTCNPVVNRRRIGAAMTCTSVDRPRLSWERESVRVIRGKPSRFRDLDDEVEKTEKRFDESVDMGSASE